MPPDIQDRNADVWEPLLMVADLAGGEWPQRARRAAKALIEAAKETEPSFGVLLLTDLKTVFGDNDKMTTADILAKLHAMEEAPWGDIRGKPLDSRRLARLLHQYGIKSHVIRMGGTTPRGYQREDFVDTWSCYVSALPATSKTAATPATFQEKQDVMATPDRGDVASVAHVAHFPGSREKATLAPDDYPEMPEFLRRSPVDDRRPALGPPGDSLDDFV